MKKHWPEVEPPVGFNRPCFQRGEFQIASLRADEFGMGFDEWHLFFRSADGSMKESAMIWLQQRDWWESADARLQQVLRKAERVIRSLRESN